MSRGSSSTISSCFGLLSEAKSPKSPVSMNSSRFKSSVCELSSPKLAETSSVSELEESSERKLSKSTSTSSMLSRLMPAASEEFVSDSETSVSSVKSSALSKVCSLIISPVADSITGSSISAVFSLVSSFCSISSKSSKDMSDVMSSMLKSSSVPAVSITCSDSDVLSVFSEISAVSFS